MIGTDPMLPKVNGAIFLLVLEQQVVRRDHQETISKQQLPDVVPTAANVTDATVPREHVHKLGPVYHEPWHGQRPVLHQRGQEEQDRDEDVQRAVPVEVLRPRGEHGVQEHAEPQGQDEQEPCEPLVTHIVVTLLDPLWDHMSHFISSARGPSLAPTARASSRQGGGHLSELPAYQFSSTCTAWNVLLYRNLVSVE